MSKIAIAGVEGSGKTVLMAVFGEKYERPDADVKPKRRRGRRLFLAVAAVLAATGGYSQHARFAGCKSPDKSSHPSPVSHPSRTPARPCPSPSPAARRCVSAGARRGRS